MLSKKKPQDKVDPEYLVGLDTASAQPTPAGVKPFIKKHWKPITAAICAAAVAAAVLVPKNSAKPAAASAQYVETRPEKRDIVNSYSADGTITAADTYTVSRDAVDAGDDGYPCRTGIGDEFEKLTLIRIAEVTFEVFTRIAHALRRIVQRGGQKNRRNRFHGA